MSPPNDPSYLPSDIPRSCRVIQSTPDSPIDAGQGKVKRPGTGKCASQHFTIHKLIGLPTRILVNKFIACEHDYDYSVLSFNQLDFALLKKDDWKSCSTGILTLCPNIVPLHDAKYQLLRRKFYSRFREKKLVAGGKYFTITAHRLCIDIAPCGSTIFENSGRSLYAAQVDVSG